METLIYLLTFLTIASVGITFVVWYYNKKELEVKNNGNSRSNNFIWGK